MVLAGPKSAHGPNPTLALICSTATTNSIWPLKTQIARTTSQKSSSSTVWGEFKNQKNVGKWLCFPNEARGVKKTQGKRVCSKIAIRSLKYRKPSLPYPKRAVEEGYGSEKYGSEGFQN